MSATTNCCVVLNTVLHWLPLLQRISYRIIALVWRSLLGLAPAYLRDLCCPTSSAQGRRSLRSTERGVLMVPFARTATKQNRAFSVVGPSLGTGSLWHCDCIPESTLNLSILASKLSFSAMLGSGALLSSNLEGALYKSL